MKIKWTDATGYSQGQRGKIEPTAWKTEVIGLEPSGITWQCRAKDNDWESFEGAFRVTKEYK